MDDREAALLLKEELEKAVRLLAAVELDNMFTRRLPVDLALAIHDFLSGWERVGEDNTTA